MLRPSVTAMRAPRGYFALSSRYYAHAPMLPGECKAYAVRSELGQVIGTRAEEAEHQAQGLPSSQWNQQVTNAWSVSMHYKGLSVDYYVLPSYVQCDYQELARDEIYEKL